MQSQCTSSHGFPLSPLSFQVTIHRSRLLEDAYAQLHGQGSNLKRRLAVTFINARVRRMQVSSISHKLTGPLAKKIVN